MSDMLQFDEATSRQIEASYTTRDVVEQRRVLLEALAPSAGDAVLDIGTGPGLLACELAEAVAPTGRVHGIDPSEAMLALARSRASVPAGRLEFSAGVANVLPFPDASFDIVTSTQVYEYLTDLAGALAEAHRVLRPGGRLLVLDTDWDSIVWHSSDPERMRRVLSAWDEHLTDPHLPRRLTALLESAGFSVGHRSTIPLFNAGFAENSYSQQLIQFVSRYVPGHRGVTEDDARAWADDLTTLGRDYFFSVNRYLFIATR